MKRSIFIFLTLIVIALCSAGCSFNKNHLLKGKWIATANDQKIYQINSDGEKVGGNENYILECDGKGNYSITLENNQIKKGTYSIDKHKSIQVTDDGKFFLGVCKLVDDDKIICDETTNTSAYKYIKYKK